MGGGNNISETNQEYKMVTEYVEADSKFTQQTHSPFAIKSHLDMYHQLELKVAEMLELLSISKIRESNHGKQNCNNDSENHGDNIDSQKHDINTQFPDNN